MASPENVRAAEILDSFPPAHVVFQPIVDLHSWRVVGVEALARFADGAPPPVHLDRASALGVRIEFEVRLLRMAVAVAAALPDDLVVTLNASGVTILLPEMEEILAALDRPWGLEIYEGHTTADLAQIRATVTRLDGKLLVDDAGAASADENRIATLRPDVVKIDRALFWQIVDDEAARARLDGLLGAARDTGARLLVEGVSDAVQLDRARALGFDLAQGYHLGTPTIIEQVPDMLVGLKRSIGIDTPGF